MKKGTIASHNISLLFWVKFFGTISFIAPVVTLFYMDRGLTAVYIIWMMMFWSGSVLVFEVPTGVFADRFGAKISFITGTAVNLLSVALLIFAYEPWVFFLSSILSGLAATFFSGAEESLIYESLKKSNEQHLMDSAMGKIQSAEFIASIIAVLTGAFLAKDLANDQFILLLSLGLAFSLVAIILLFFVKQLDNEEQFRENPFHHVKDGLKVIRQQPQLIFLVLNFTIVFIPIGIVFEKFEQPFLTHAGLPVILLGVLYAFSSFFSFFASRYIGWLTQKFGRVFLMYVSGGLSAICLLLAGLFGHTLFIALTVFFIIRFVVTIRYPIYSQLTNDWIPSGSRATTLSLLSIVDSLFDLIILGTISSVAILGIPTIYLFGAMIVLIGTIIPIKSAIGKDHKINSENMS